MPANHDEILNVAVRQVEDGHFDNLDPDKRGAVNVQGMLDALRKYGPGVIAALAPLTGGFNTATVASVVINLVQTIAAGSAPAADPAS